VANLLQSRLDGYVIPPLKAMGVGVKLKTQKSFSISIFDSPYRGDSKLITPEELIEFMKATAPNATCLMPDPRPERFEIFSKEATTQLVKVAHAMVAEKMQAKHKGFWSDAAQAESGHKT
jgi:hypothetical protein